MRASIRKEHPEYAFGEISRIIGVEVGFRPYVVNISEAAFKCSLIKLLTENVKLVQKVQPFELDA